LWYDFADTLKHEVPFARLRQNLRFSVMLSLHGGCLASAA